MIAGFAEDASGARRHLIRTDDERIAVRCAHRLRFERREPKRRIRSIFPCKRTLIGVRRDDLEDDTEAREELLPVAGGRSQDEPPGLSPHLGYGFVLTQDFQR